MNNEQIKLFSLDFLGEDWKDAYIKFKAFSFSDVREKFPKVLNVKKDTPDRLFYNISEGLDKLLKILSEQFISGKASSENGLVDIEASDLEDFPPEVLVHAVTFLTQSGNQKIQQGALNS